MTRTGGHSLSMRRALAALSATLLLLVSWSWGHEASAAASAGVARLHRGAVAQKEVWDSIVVDAPEGGLTHSPFAGRLPQPLSSYREHGDDFYKLVRGKGWNGHARLRTCEGCPAGKTTKMQIQAITNLHRDPLTGLPENGVVVGRMMNIGAYMDATTHVAAGSGRHPDQYYFVITDEHKPRAAKLWVARVQFDPDGQPRKALEIVPGNYEFEKCRVRHVEADRHGSDGDFRSCPRRHAPSRPVQRSRGAARPGGLSSMLHLAAFAEALPQDAASAYAWFSCDAGCCSAKWPP